MHNSTVYGQEAWRWRVNSVRVRDKQLSSDGEPEQRASRRESESLGHVCIVGTRHGVKEELKCAKEAVVCSRQSQCVGWAIDVDAINGVRHSVRSAAVYVLLLGFRLRVGAVLKTGRRRRLGRWFRPRRSACHIPPG